MKIVKDILNYARGLFAGEIENLGWTPRNEDRSIDRPSQFVAVIGSLMAAIGLLGLVFGPAVLAANEIRGWWPFVDVVASILALGIGAVLLGWSQRNVKSYWD